MATAYLSSTNAITAEHNHASPTLIPTPDGSYILSYLRKDTSTQLTNFAISMENHHAYAIIATMDTPIKIKLPTTITIDGSNHQQIFHLQHNPQYRSVLGRANTSLFQNPLIQNMNPSVPIPKVHHTKELTGRKTEKISGALTLL